MRFVVSSAVCSATPRCLASTAGGRSCIGARGAAAWSKAGCVDELQPPLGHPRAVRRDVRRLRAHVAACSGGDDMNATTHGRGLSEAQRELRRTGIGGSEIAAVLGEATRTTEDGAIRSGFDVWLEKNSPMERINTVDAERGIYLEGSVVDWYMARTGFKRGLTLGTVKHSTRPFALCTPDALALLPDGRGRLVSVKCPRHAYDWGEDGTDDVPVDYYLQLQWEFAVCSSFMREGALDTRMDLACFVSGELRIYHIEADLERQDDMLALAEAWWQRHMVNGEMPPLDASAGCRHHLKGKWKQRQPLREATAVEEQLMAELRAARLASDAAKDVYDVARRRVENAIQDAAGLQSPLGVVTWKPRADGVRVFNQTWTKEKKP